MPPSSREAYAREFLVGNARVKKPENQLKDFDGYMRVLHQDAFWQTTLVYFYEELLSVYCGLVPPMYQVLNLATVYLILHPTQQSAAASFLPLLLWEELKQTSDNVVAQLHIMCSFLHKNIPLTTEALMDYRSTLDEYVAAHCRATDWIETRLEKLLQKLLYTSQIRSIASNQEVFILNMLATTGENQNPDELTPQATTALQANDSAFESTQRERETLEQWLRDHNLY